MVVLTDAELFPLTLGITANRALDIINQQSLKNNKTFINIRDIVNIMLGSSISKLFTRLVMRLPGWNKLTISLPP